MAIINGQEVVSVQPTMGANAIERGTVLGPHFAAGLLRADGIFAHFGPATSISGTFTKVNENTRGLIMFSSTAYQSSGPAIYGYNVSIDGVYQFGTFLFMNETGSHKTLPTVWVPFPDTLFGTAAIAAGTHTVTIAYYGATTSDTNDLFYSTFFEFPDTGD